MEDNKMTLRNTKGTTVTFEANEVLISRQVGISKSKYIAIKIEPEESYEFVLAKVNTLVSMDDEMFTEMCRIAKYDSQNEDS